MTDGLAIDIEKVTEENSYFRRVIFTSEYSQLVLMNILPGEDIGNEVHPETDQFLRFESGEGEAIINNKKYRIYPGTAFFVPRGTWHNFINTSDKDLKLYTLYSPPHHPEGTIQKVKP